MKQKKLTPRQKNELINVIDGRIYLIESEIKRLEKLLITDLKAVKNYIETL